MNFGFDLVWTHTYFRLVEACSLMPKCTNNEKDILSVTDNMVLPIEIKGGKIFVDKKLGKLVLKCTKYNSLILLVWLKD